MITILVYVIVGLLVLDLLRGLLAGFTSNGLGGLIILIVVLYFVVHGHL